MDALKASTFQPFHFAVNSTTLPPIQFHKPNSPFPSKPLPFSPLRTTHSKAARFKLFTAISPDVWAEAETEGASREEKFDWYAQWYPVMPLCDLDKRRPHGKRILGIDVVVWWDRNEGEWKVMDDACPHRLAPLSEGRIDQWGRLQCVYHGWCFSGSGDCKFIPQAPRDGPPIHTSKRACVAVYPSCVQNDILWFWPNSDPLYKDIFMKKKPVYIPELDDPSFTKSMIARDIPYGYEVLIENLMDPAHVHYAHHGIMRIPPTPESLKADREGGKPLEISLMQLDVNGFTGKQLFGGNIFAAPCVYYGYYTPGPSTTSQSTSSPKATEEKPSNAKVKRAFLVFYCVPVSPGNSRLIFASPRNFAVWIDKVVPRWMFHIGQNLILDSDLYLLHVEEHKLKEIGPYNWHKSCFVPTKADTLVVAFRRWLNKYAGGQVDWRGKFSGALPQTPPREQLMDRYWSHTVKCSSCNAAYKSLSVLEVALQVISIASIGIVAAAKRGLMSVATRNTLIAMAVLCFLASRWLSHFTYKTFRFHDYDHAFR
ncbi:protochlorophyllide-dependent translocon component 52, chloroplastic-like [Ipomoea triloba]|uniref:protochlorophyllide-dependent translocon component 52, chloroplastic-like n=1 Tax=Ipomoea triloba TaxID=35885 RepID=UPI00125DD0BF|nr:protochlorophyllide-dependent translocon component 52, chloroplastic-like [Ipomoea triloba]